MADKLVLDIDGNLVMCDPAGPTGKLSSANNSSEIDCFCNVDPDNCLNLISSCPLFCNIPPLTLDFAIQSGCQHLVTINFTADLTRVPNTGDGAPGYITLLKSSSATFGTFNVIQIPNPNIPGCVGYNVSGNIYGNLTALVDSGCDFSGDPPFCMIGGARLSCHFNLAQTIHQWVLEAVFFPSGFFIGGSSICPFWVHQTIDPIVICATNSMIFIQSSGQGGGCGFGLNWDNPTNINLSFHN